MMTTKAHADAGANAAADMPSLDDLADPIKQFKLPGINVMAIFVAQGKGIQALADTNREACEGITALVDRRNRRHR